MTEAEIRDELKRLWMARSHLLQQIHAGEETFRTMPTWDKTQRLANRRHELHLIEVDIVDFDNQIAERESKQREVRKALRELGVR